MKTLVHDPATALLEDTSDAPPSRATTMRAIVINRYGSPDVLQLREIATPVVNDDSVLVRVHAASVNAYDWHIMRGLPYLVRMVEGLRAPKRQVLGVDMAGIVEEVGKSVTQFRPGDAVFGETDRAFAEYTCARERDLVLKPANLSMEQAAAVPMAAYTALQALRDKGALQPGQTVLVHGAAGGVGTFAVQIAKAFGAEVTAVCSTKNVALVQSIGADHAVDYTREDIMAQGRRYDLILDIAGHRSLSDFRRLLAPNGTLVVVGAPQGEWVGPLVRPLATLVRSRLTGQRMRTLLATRSNADMVVLKELIEAGKVTPVIDRSYPLSETADAVRYLETGHPSGKVVITV